MISSLFFTSSTRLAGMSNMGKRCWTVESMAKIISNLGVISHPVSNLVSNPIRSGYILIIWMILSVSVYSINQTGISETKVSRRREFLTFRFLAKWVIFTLKLYELPVEARGRFWVRSVRRTSAACADMSKLRGKRVKRGWNSRFSGKMGMSEFLLSGKSYF